MIPSTIELPQEWAVAHREDDGEQQPIGAVERAFGVETQSPRHGLELMWPLVEALGHPQRAYATIHITGSKGKGSTAAVLTAVLRAAGYRVGTYTSPSLTHFGERILVDGVPIRDSECEPYISRLLDVAASIDQAPPRFFEAATAIAFAHFAKHEVDVAVIEVGMGGLRDATNVVDPLLSIITSIELEHTQILGDTLAQIAREKAGIVKRGRPVLSAVEDQVSSQPIVEICASQGSTHLQIGRDFGFGNARSARTRQRLDVWLGEELGGGSYRDIDLSLPGEAQLRNASLAVAAARIVSRSLPAVNESAIRRGLASTVWPGRLELRRVHCDVLLDVAHTPASARHLRRHIDRYFANQPRTLVIGVLREKNVDAIAAELAEGFDRVIAAPVKWFRTMDPAVVQQAFRAAGSAVDCCESVCAGIAEALRATPADGLIVVAGSVFAVGEAKRRFGWVDDAR